MTSNALSGRDYAIFFARTSGRRLDSIAQEHQISRERVRQIVARCLRRLMNAEKKWAAAERACFRIQQECRAKRIEEWAHVVRQTAKTTAFPGIVPSVYLTLDDLSVSMRVYNVLKHYDKTDLGQICQLKATEFLNFKNAGRVSLRELRAELDRIGAPHNLGG